MTGTIVVFDHDWRGGPGARILQAMSQVLLLPVDGRGMQSLKELLREGEAFSVDRDDEDEDMVWISYNDLLANEYADRVEESIAVLGALAGVEKAWHEDREVVAVRGTSLSLTPIETALRRFWSGVPRLPARWAEETKIVERALVQILKPERFRKRSLIWNRVTAGGLVHVVDLYRTNYENHVRPGMLLTVGVYYRKAPTAGHVDGPGRWFDGQDCQLTWEPTSGRPQHFTDNWPLDEDCDSVAREIAGRVRDQFLPDFARLQKPADVVQFLRSRPTHNSRIGDWDRIPFLVAAGEMAEAQRILFTSFAKDGPSRDSHFRIAEYLGLSMDPARYR